MLKVLLEISLMFLMYSFVLTGVCYFFWLLPSFARKYMAYKANPDESLQSLGQQFRDLVILLIAYLVFSIQIGLFLEKSGISPYGLLIGILGTLVLSGIIYLLIEHSTPGGFQKIDLREEAEKSEDQVILII